jgi:GAF domain-containing protein/anti-sigma regulatory factor (Ser/Thr protein kinase)
MTIIVDDRVGELERVNAELQRKLDERTAELKEALDQQTATAEVLQVINSSPGDLAPVFNAMLEKATRLCEAAYGQLATFDGEFFRFVAVHGENSVAEQQPRDPLPPSYGVTWSRIVRGEHVIHLADVMETGVYRDGHTAARRFVEIGGGRSLLTVALRKDTVVLGALTVYRQEVRPFSDKQITLLQNFAAQAVIAMENARLITETREALAQQAAMAEVLQVINSSPGNLAPVFDAMLEKAMQLCDAAFGGLWTFDEGRYVAAALRGVPRDYTEFLANTTLIPGPGTAPYRFLHGERLVHNVDLASEEPYRAGDAQRRALVDLGGARTALQVPLRKDDDILGVITIYRQEVRPFSDKQIALLQNFAAQAVIAMENARLLTETREALEQQTATTEVLQVINSSPGDLAPVFDAMLDKALNLCEASFGLLCSHEGDTAHILASRNLPPPYLDFMTREPLRVGPETLHGRAIVSRSVVQVADISSEQPYRKRVPLAVAAVELGGVRTAAFIPLLKDDGVPGLLLVYRQEVRPFTDKQIALLQNFAAQAVIAIENARLITETREALEQQTATAEVLQVINSSPGDLTPVFDVILEKAHTLCSADIGALVSFDGEHLQALAIRGMPAAFDDFVREPFVPDPNSFEERLIRQQRLIHIPDVQELGPLPENPITRAAIRLGGIRTALFVPLCKDAEAAGYIAAARSEVRPFTDKQIALLQSFAAQAVIAMENARLITETREALEQQTATAEVLQVINSSPGDLAPVFDAMLEKAMRLCGAAFGVFAIYDEEHYRVAATHGVPVGLAEFVRQAVRIHPGSMPDRIRRGEDTIQVSDITALGSELRTPGLVAMIELGNARTAVWVALRKDGVAQGFFGVYRQEVRPFTEKQIALLQNFAAQAVIAMENARLITETREALEQQTATAEVLKVISGSAFDLQTVLDTLVESANRLCEADMTGILRPRGDVFQYAASYGYSPNFRRFMETHPIRMGRGTIVGRTLLERRPVHIPDIDTDPEYTFRDAQRAGNFRSMLGVPLLRDSTAIGVIVLMRSQVRPFTERQIELVVTFADQAVIAIENARLLGELRERTDDLQESLEYQTATSDVLKVISQSTFDLQPVLETLAGTASRLCEAQMAFVFRRDGELYRVAASVGFSSETKALVEANPVSPGRGTVAGRTALTASVVHIPDARLDPEYTWGEFIRVAKTPTMLGVPLLREGVPVGVIVLARERVEPFSDKQIELVRTFADQAVIAIENARLFNELRARTDELGSSVAELKMLSEVGQAVSSTLDLRSVLSTILNASLGVTWANAGAIFRYSRAERAFRLVEAVGWDEALARSVRELRVAETESAMGEAAALRAPIQLADLAQRESYPLRDVTLAAGFHSALIVPLVGAERILGAIILMRQEAGEFPAETVRLMQTLASQSVLAIQNARLFREIADKSEQLALASQHKSQFLANMSHELRTPLNAILGYAELLVEGIYGQLSDRPRGVLERIQNNGKHLLALINDVLDLAKIEAGQLALTLEDYSVPDLVHSVVTATEPLAAGKGLKFTAALQDDLPMAHGDARRVSQVLLNLVGNAIKFTDEGEVEIRAAAERGQFVLTVRDTGPGIPDADQEMIFGEFQQIDSSNTRKKGGTGLGLAISKRMVEMQGGTIWVESVLGQGSTFRVVLPVYVDEVMEAA